MKVTSASAGIDPGDHQTLPTPSLPNHMRRENTEEPSSPSIHTRPMTDAPSIHTRPAARFSVGVRAGLGLLLCIPGISGLLGYMHRVGFVRWIVRGSLPLALMTSGCSLIFVNGPPDSPLPPPAGPNQYVMVPKCTTSRAWPIVDSVIGGYQVVRTVYAFSASDSAYSGAPISREVDIAAGISLTTLFIASAIAGYGRTSACDEYRARLTVTRPMTPVAPAVPPSAPLSQPVASPPAAVPPPVTVPPPAAPLGAADGAEVAPAPAVSSSAPTTSPPALNEADTSPSPSAQP